MKKTITEEACARLGFNDLFAEEVERVLSVFRRVSPSLRNAAIFCVASRHSLYIGGDEVPTRALDLRRIQLSPYLEPQQSRDPHKFVRRLAARLGPRRAAQRVRHHPARPRVDRALSVHA